MDSVSILCLPKPGPLDGPSPPNLAEVPFSFFLSIGCPGDHDVGLTSHSTDVKPVLVVQPFCFTFGGLVQKFLF
jgi:hypothetical protein